MKPFVYDVSIETIEKLIDKKGITIILDFQDDLILTKVDSIFSYNEKSKILNILVSKLEDANKALLIKIIRKVHETDGLILKQSKDDELISYSNYISDSGEDKKILDFFINKLPNDDYFALKMSLFLRNQAKSEKNIFPYKMDIRDKFGDRGVNIANLCSAGYFEEFISFYKAVSKETFDNYYEMVVGARARALFVNFTMNVAEIEKQINIMVEKAINYHMPDFRVHGKGKNNVSNINEFIKSRNGKEGYTIHKVNNQIYDNPALLVVEYIFTIKRETK